MPENEITLDSKALKALGAETRVSILKALGERQKTQSELAKELKLSKPATLEHLGKLSNAGLVEKMDEGRKWKYYKLTNYGSKIIGKAPLNVVIVLALSLIVALSSLLFLSQHIGGISQPQETNAVSYQTANQKMLESADTKNANVTEPENAGIAKPENAEASQTKNDAANLSQLFPSFILLIVSILAAGLSIGYLMKNR